MAATEGPLLIWHLSHALLRAEGASQADGAGVNALGCDRAQGAAETLSAAAGVVSAAALTLTE
eukprot:5554438-Pleurochrysis_carterae.AAC.3